jgi:hypothetical protein
MKFFEAQERRANGLNIFLEVSGINPLALDAKDFDLTLDLQGEGDDEKNSGGVADLTTAVCNELNIDSDKNWGFVYNSLQSQIELIDMKNKFLGVKYDNKS